MALADDSNHTVRKVSVRLLEAAIMAVAVVGANVYVMQQLIVNRVDTIEERLKTHAARKWHEESGNWHIRAQEQRDELRRQLHRSRPGEDWGG